MTGPLPVPNMPVVAITPGRRHHPLVRQSDALREIAARDALIAELKAHAKALERMHNELAARERSPTPEYEALEICDAIGTYSGSYELEIWRRCEKAHGIGV